MTTPRDRPDDTPLDAPTSLDEDIIALQGEVRPIDQDAVLDVDELEHRREPTQTELDQGDPSPDPSVVAGASAELDGLARHVLRQDETDDAGVATQEGIPWIPPVDPPFVPDREAPDGIDIAAGMAGDAFGERYDDDHRSEGLSEEPDLTARIRDALRADAATSGLVDRLLVATVGDRVVVRGVVQTVDDGDTITDVVQRVAGVGEVVDETVLAE